MKQLRVFQLRAAALLKTVMVTYQVMFNDFEDFGQAKVICGLEPPVLATPW